MCCKFNKGWCCFSISLKTIEKLKTYKAHAALYPIKGKPKTIFRLDFSAIVEVGKLTTVVQLVPHESEST